MRKFIILILTLITCVIFIDACSSKTLNLVKQNIAEVHYNIYAGASDEVSCTYSGGKREQTYVLNGYATPLIDFGLITFVVKKEYVPDTASFELVADNISYEGVLEQNPYDGSLVADIKHIITTPTQMTATIRIGSFMRNVIIYALSTNWKVGYNSALDIATKASNKTLKNMIKDGCFLGETYIKILKDTSNASINTYYWFVSFLGRTGTKISVLIDPNNGNILATQ